MTQYEELFTPNRAALTNQKWEVRAAKQTASYDLVGTILGLMLNSHIPKHCKNSLSRSRNYYNTQWNKNFYGFFCRRRVFQAIFGRFPVHTCACILQRLSRYVASICNRSWSAVFLVVFFFRMRQIRVQANTIRAIRDDRRVRKAEKLITGQAATSRRGLSWNLEWATATVSAEAVGKCSDYVPTHQKWNHQRNIAIQTVMGCSYGKSLMADIVAVAFLNQCRFYWNLMTER